jgi:tetratricopeptide (TPR) repeat protein
MELVLTIQPDNAALVTCDGGESHRFDPVRIVPDAQDATCPPDDPVAYGRALFAALFSPGSPAHAALALRPERIMLVADGPLDALPWEYLHGPEGFLVLDVPFVRGLPTAQRCPPPTLEGGLHIVAVPSNPLDPEVPPLNIDGEWLRLRESITAVEGAVTLERTRPATDEQLRRQVAGKRHRVVHFMGHGDEREGEAILCFERDDGGLAVVTARTLAQRLRGTTFLVTLNACVSAAPGPTPFSNVARLLVEQGTPYTLGMRFSIADDDARAFSRTFYDDLARGVPVEEALLQARLSLARSARPWAIGVPVFYTALAVPAGGFAAPEGRPAILDRRPPLAVSALPRAEGAFQGRQGELQAIGAQLTGDNRPAVLTVHGFGGQGKTALAREATERFAWAFPGGVWAISLENLPTRAQMVANLAGFFGISIDTGRPEQIEQQVLARLHQQRTLLILDNVETLIAAVEDKDAEALRLVELIKHHIAGVPVTLLVTSRTLLGWPGELLLELHGLHPIEGRQLFRACAPQRRIEANDPLAEQLSRLVDGHPLSLRLLGSAFDTSQHSLEAFLKEYELTLSNANDKYRTEDHRHRSLYASIETSVRYLTPELRDLLSGLWIFHSPFLPDTATTIFAPDATGAEGTILSVPDRLHALWWHSLLIQEIDTLEKDSLLHYRLLPTLRFYIERDIPQTYDRDVLLARFAGAYVNLVRWIYRDLDRNSRASHIALLAREDIERGLIQCVPDQQGEYQMRWGWIMGRLGDRQRALALCEAALEQLQGSDPQLTLATLHNMAGVYHDLGQPQRALQIYEAALPILQTVDDRVGKATTLNNIALVYRGLGQPQRALQFYEEALPILRAMDDRAREATMLNNIAAVYDGLGQPQRALQLYEEVLPIRRAVGDRAGEATTLNNMALVYDGLGHPQRALQLYEEALPIRRAVGDRAGEATTLNNMALVYRGLGQPQRALQLHAEALPIRRAVGDQAGEATTLNNMALVYQGLGQPQRALQLHAEALPITRAVGDRAEEATTLHGMALVYRGLGQLQRALVLYEEVLPIMRAVGDRAGEVATLNGMAYLFVNLQRFDEALSAYEDSITLAQQILYPSAEIAGFIGVALLLSNHLGRREDALARLDAALQIFAHTDLPQDAAGQTPDQVRQLRETMQRGVTPSQSQSRPATLPPKHLQVIVTNTVVVLVNIPEKRAEWRGKIADMLINAQQRGDDWQIEVDLYTTVLAFLDGKEPELPPDHPYAAALAAIRSGVDGGGVQASEPTETALVDSEFIQRSIAALLADPHEKLSHVQYLNALADGSNVPDLKALIHAIQTALFGGDLVLLGAGLVGPYAEACAAIVAGVTYDGLDPRLFATISDNTLAVLGPSIAQRDQWRRELAQLQVQAEQDKPGLAALTGALGALLDAGGDTQGLGTGLRGIYATTWQTIVEQLGS